MTAVVAKRKTTARKFRTVQKRRKLHYTIHGHTAAELIQQRANGDQKNMGLTSWENSPDGKILKSGVSVAKNYLKPLEFDGFSEGR